MLLLPAHSITTLNTIHHTDAMSLLRALPSNYVNCIVTSPPYFGLRDYGVAGQIGLESTPQAFVKRLVDLFREARRVLRDDGTFWLNLGDSYNGSGKGATVSDKSAIHYKANQLERKTDVAGIAGKNLLMIPARVAIALQDDGWILRSECIWVKPNPMPESVTDRPTKAHEMVYLFAKSSKYWYDAEAIREDCTAESGGGWSKAYAKAQPEHGAMNTARPLVHKRNRRDVFTVTIEPTPFAHFATFPQALIKPFILAGCPEKVCAACSKPYVREVEATGGTIGKGGWHDHSDDLGKGMQQVRGNGVDRSTRDYQRIDKGLRAACNCETTNTRAGIVLDMFMGSGTTALVARYHGRNYIGSELNADYVKLANERLRLPFEMRPVQQETKVDDLPLFALTQR